MIITWEITIPPLTGDAPRRAYVCLPEGREESGRSYPVLYMFDGHNVFFDDHATYGKSWGMADYMEKTRTPLIIVGIECNHSPDGGRLSEYSPLRWWSLRWEWAASLAADAPRWIGWCAPSSR